MYYRKSPVFLLDMRRQKHRRLRATIGLAVGYDISRMGSKIDFEKNPMVRNLASVYKAPATTRARRVSILSLVAHGMHRYHYKRTWVQEMFGVSNSQIENARIHGNLYGPGADAVSFSRAKKNFAEGPTLAK